MTQPQFDVTGIGLNATDTLILLPQFPPYAGKIAFESECLSPGGQVASAMAACAHLGLRVKYVGTVGDDERGRVQLESLRQSGIDLSSVQIRSGCPNQTAYILIDRTTGERTVLWSRPECLRLAPDEITEDQIVHSRLLHIDAHDTPAVAKAARIAQSHGIPVTLDVDTLYPALETLFPYVDYMVASHEFPSLWTHEADPYAALDRMQREYGMKAAAMTLGSNGALALKDGRLWYSPGYVVNCVDTTGAGDVFHGAFCFGLLEGFPFQRVLDFANAMAALNCTALGARGGIHTRADAESLMKLAVRRLHPDFTAIPRS